MTASEATYCEDADIRPVPGFCMYSVDIYGNVYGRDGRALYQYVDPKGYCRVRLSKDGVKKSMWVHRIVAMAFIPNPQGMPQVNHIDENPSNNQVSNLEWCDAKYNSNYGKHKERISSAAMGRKVSNEVKKKISEAHKGKEPKGATQAAVIRNSKPVVQIINGNIVAYYESAHEAGRRTGINYVHICDCCRGDRNTAGGFSWAYTHKEVAL